MTRRWLPLVLALCAAHAGAAAVASSPQPIRFTFEVLEGGGSGSGRGDAFVDLGRMAAASSGTRGQPILVSRTVAVRLDGAARTARVSVALLAETRGCTVRLDGITLSTIPRIIDPMHRVGSPVVHRIEMSIPAGVPPGPFLSNLQWLAETD